MLAKEGKSLPGWKQAWNKYEEKTTLNCAHKTSGPGCIALREHFLCFGACFKKYSGYGSRKINRQSPHFCARVQNLFWKKRSATVRWPGWVAHPDPAAPPLDIPSRGIPVEIHFCFGFVCHLQYFSKIFEGRSCNVKKKTKKPTNQKNPED